MRHCVVRSRGGGLAVLDDPGLDILAVQVVARHTFPLVWNAPGRACLNHVLDLVDKDEWIATVKHPRFDRLYADCVYQPMVELLEYLRDLRK